MLSISIPFLLTTSHISLQITSLLLQLPVLISKLFLISSSYFLISLHNQLLTDRPDYLILLSIYDTLRCCLISLLYFVKISVEI
jgi:hypothetical protein